MSTASEIVTKYVCPALGVIIGNFMFSAPFRSLKEALSNGSLGSLNPTPWAFMTGNCAGWVAYSYFTKDLFVFFGNAPGFLLSIWFNLVATKLQYQDIMQKNMRNSILETMKHDPSSDLLDVLLEDRLERAISDASKKETNIPAPHQTKVMIIITIWVIVFSLVALLNAAQTTKESIIGIIVNINLLFFFAAPLSTMITVIKTRNSVSIHRWTMLTNTLNGAFWGTYGLAIVNPILYVPNLIGVLLGVIQIILILTFPKIDEEKDDTQNSDTALHEKNVP